MKAGSAVFTTIQRPYTVMGLPPKLGLLVVASGMGVFALLTIFNFQKTGFALTIFGIASGLAYLWVQNRKNHHFEAKVMVTIPSWLWKVSDKAFIAGKPPERKNKKEKKHVK